MKTYKINGHEYAIDILGVWHQLNPKPFKYDDDYGKTYDTPEYRKGTERLMEIRLDTLKASLNLENVRILDYGCGRGDFVNYLSDKGYDCMGYDLYPFKGKQWDGGLIDVACFWDVFEHGDATEMMKAVKMAPYIAMSLPNRPRNIEDLATWKHTKPNEHIAHYDLGSLMRTMKYFGYSLLHSNYNECEIRTGNRNILTAVFNYDR